MKPAVQSKAGKPGLLVRRSSGRVERFSKETLETDIRKTGISRKVAKKISSRIAREVGGTVTVQSSTLKERAAELLAGINARLVRRYRQYKQEIAEIGLLRTKKYTHDRIQALVGKYGHVQRFYGNIEIEISDPLEFPYGRVFSELLADKYRIWLKKGHNGGMVIIAGP